MKDVPENELFSAYLDGELTAAEEAEVERLLARSPHARQLLDELRALSNTLQGLPAARLDEDLTASILRKAERQMLSEPMGHPKPPTPEGSIDAARPAPQPAGVSEEVPPWWKRFRPRLNRRALAWSAAAIAVALVLMIFERPGSDRGPSDDRELSDASDARVSSMSSGDDGNKSPAPDEGGATLAGTGDEREMAQDPHVAEAGRGSGHVIEKGGIADVTDGKLTGGRGQSGPAAVEVPEVSTVVELAKKQLGSLADKDLPSVPEDAAETQTLGLLADAAATPIVVLDISAEAARDDAFADLLATHNIVLEESPEALGFGRFGGRGGKAYEKAALAAKRQLEFAQKRPAVGKLEFVLVDATAEQWAGIHAQLENQPERFPAWCVAGSGASEFARKLNRRAVTMGRSAVELAQDTADAPPSVASTPVDEKLDAGSEFAEGKVAKNGHGSISGRAAEGLQTFNDTPERGKQYRRANRMAGRAFRVGTATAPPAETRVRIGQADQVSEPDQGTPGDDPFQSPAPRPKSATPQAQPSGGAQHASPPEGPGVTSPEPPAEVPEPAPKGGEKYSEKKKENALGPPTQAPRPGPAPGGMKGGWDEEPGADADRAGEAPVPLESTLKQHARSENGSRQPASATGPPGLPQIAQERLKEGDEENRSTAGQPGGPAQQYHRSPGEPGYGFAENASEAEPREEVEEQPHLKHLRETEAAPRRYRALFALRVVPGPPDTAAASIRRADEVPPAGADALTNEQALPAQQPAEPPAPAAQQ